MTIKVNKNKKYFNVSFFYDNTNDQEKWER